MSRKHAPLPDPDDLTIKKAIRRRLNELLADGKTIDAILLDRATFALFRKTAGGYWELHGPELFGHPVVLDPLAEGWSVRVKEA